MVVLKNPLKSVFNGIVSAFKWYHNSVIETEKMMEGLDPHTQARIYLSMYPFRRW